jgi:hypothetical protein
MPSDEPRAYAVDGIRSGSVGEPELGEHMSLRSLAARVLSTVSVVALLSGAVVVSPAAAATGPVLHVSRTSVHFGNVRVGTFSDPIEVALKNTGDSTLTFEDASFEGDTDFLPLAEPDCGDTNTLAAGDTCTLLFFMIPFTKGPRSGTFVITSDSNGGESTPISLSGNGTVGYYLVNQAGYALSFGDAHLTPAAPTGFGSTAVGSAGTPTGSGLWIAYANGGVTTAGDAPFHGSMAGHGLNHPIVGIAATPTGEGYWLVASDGGIFAFGDAHYFGSTGSIHLNKPIVGMAVTPSGQGYWLVASDGGIFAFGDAHFFGSTGSTHLNKPIVGMAPSVTGLGYWLVASDGGIFAFGHNAHFFGSTGSLHLVSPIVGFAPTAAGDGYWMAAADGGVFAFGPGVAYKGSAGGTGLGGFVSIVSSSPPFSWLFAVPLARQQALAHGAHALPWLHLSARQRKLLG